ncbi:MAG: hypothetical protein LUC97_06910 [Clostridiales bacterium]|nr:hypothetical protein [Clostridiales bacterium]
MKSKLILICVIFTMAFASVGCSAEKTLKDTEAGYEMNYDGTVWKVSKNTEVEADYGTYTYSAVFTSVSKTEEGESAATFKVLREDLSEFSYTDEDSMLDEVADKLAARLDDGIITYQNVAVSGLKGYWIGVTPMEETDSVTDLIFFISDDSVYEFYYTTIGDENYSLYETDVNYMLYNFSVL